MCHVRNVKGYGGAVISGAQSSLLLVCGTATSATCLVSWCAEHMIHSLHSMYHCHLQLTESEEHFPRNDVSFVCESVEHVMYENQVSSGPPIHRRQHLLDLLI